LSDMMVKVLLVPESHDSSALGADAVALYDVGQFDYLYEVKDWIDIVHHHVPNKENTAIYLEMFYMYERLYNRLKEEFDCIAAFQRKK
ncbi:gluconate kinase, partial [Bacillus tropicus]|nr:gluconate kinase [Bacillus tropicus]